MTRSSASAGWADRVPAGQPSVIDHVSPNHGPRRGGLSVDTIVVHYTDTRTVADSLEILCSPERQVSAHYLIGEDGAVYRLVPETERAWHAGLSFWRGERDVNSRSIGIELQNPGERFGYRAFPDAQMSALAALCAGLKRRWPIEERNVIGHSDVAPDRKTDPGVLFDWRAFSRAGHGLWPEAGEEAADPVALPEMLREIGYDPDCGMALAAFQQHYRPALVDNQPDAETAALAAALLQRIRAGST